MSVIPAIALIVSGALVMLVGQLARHGRLPRNDLVGVRTARIMRSADSWSTAHRVAGPYLVVAGAGMLPAGIAILVVRSDSAVAIAALGGAAWLLVFVLLGARLGDRAIRHLDADDR